MKKMLLAFALVALTASSAAAQRTTKADDSDAQSLPGKIKVLDMSNEEIEGGVPTGSGMDATVRAFASFGSLIRIRTNFIAEITKAADDI
jgi:hypothetical protein